MVISRWLSPHLIDIFHSFVFHAKLIKSCSINTSNMSLHVFTISIYLSIDLSTYWLPCIDRSISLSLSLYKKYLWNFKFYVRAGSRPSSCFSSWTSCSFSCVCRSCPCARCATSSSVSLRCLLLGGWAHGWVDLEHSQSLVETLFQPPIWQGLC